MAIKESTHWYDVGGNPRYTVTGKNGKERPTTLRDARADNLYPSVTSIMGMAAKPGLERWKLNQAILAALTLPKLEGESLDDFAKRALEDSAEQAREAAKRGTEIHTEIERGFTQWESDSPAFGQILFALRALFPEFKVDDRSWIAEDSFCHVEAGYAGKVDLYAVSQNRLVVVDFKTKDDIIEVEPKKLVYDEHGVQLAAYANGLIDKHDFTGSRVDRVSVFIDRKDQQIVKFYVWDQESFSRHWDMFDALRQYWFSLKKYNPKAGG